MIISNILLVFASPSNLDLKEIQIKDTDNTDIRKRSATVKVKDGRFKNRILFLSNKLDFTLHIDIRKNIVDGVRTRYRNINQSRVCRNSTLFTIYELKKLKDSTEAVNLKDVLIRSYASRSGSLFVCMNSRGDLYALPFRHDWLPIDCVWQKNHAHSSTHFSHRYFPKGETNRKWYLAVDRNGNGMPGPWTSFSKVSASWRMSAECDTNVLHRFLHLRRHVVIDGTNFSLSTNSKNCDNLFRNEINRDRAFSEEVLRRLEDIEARLVGLFTSFRTKPQEIRRFRKRFKKWIQMHWTVKLVRMKVVRLKRRKKRFTKKLKKTRVRNDKRIYREKIKQFESRLAQRTKILVNEKRRWKRVENELITMLRHISLSNVQPRRTGRTRLHDYISSIVHVRMYSISNIRLAVYLNNLHRKYKNDMQGHVRQKYRQLRRRMRIIRRGRKKSDQILPFAAYFRKRRDLEPSRPVSQRLFRDWLQLEAKGCVKRWKTQLQQHRKKKHR